MHLIVSHNFLHFGQYATFCEQIAGPSKASSLVLLAKRGNKHATR